jgi:hypothetical protein
LIKHIVLFKFKDFAKGAHKAENVRIFNSQLEALEDLVDEIRIFEVGINFADSDVAYDLALYSEFESKEDLYSYQRHPEHLKVADMVKKVCEARVVADYIV